MALCAPDKTKSMSLELGRGQCLLYTLTSLYPAIPLLLFITFFVLWQAWLRVLAWLLLHLLGMPDCINTFINNHYRYNFIDILSLAVSNVTLTSNPAGNVFCNGSEVIFTCETRGSDTLEWHDGFYLGSDTRQIGFVATLHNISETRTILSNAGTVTVATLTNNSLDDNDVVVLESTLRITALTVAPSGDVRCVRDDHNESHLDFQVLGEFVRIATTII